MNQYVWNVNVLSSSVISQKPIYRAMFENNQFYTPDFVLAKLNEYRKVFLEKLAVNGLDLKAFTRFLFARITVVPDSIFSEAAYSTAEVLVADIDPKDIVHVALNEEINTPVLTRDKELCEGLKAKRYTCVRLFNDFTAGQKSEEES